ncbi:alpha/beta-Hydrolases superfamily protein [Striga asiatica]|uniref:Alpha/beta-Hydrolases superfamily protein n=1 Tax=Striga asiatica TaxID=4170 RepID=A0A5A7QNY1_STRAF|nr:alpha/beta-Hydrolases superfamily protein [Striga asiatica]
MSLTVVACGKHQLPLRVLPQPHNFYPHDPNSQLLLHFNSALKWDPSQFSSFSSHKRIRQPKFLVGASSPSFPLGGSGADYADQLQGSRPDKKREQVVGVDEEVEDPSLLADPGSCFCEFNGVHLHHKICEADSSAPDTLIEASTPQSPDSAKRIGFRFPMILLHGFGASTFSWNRAMKPLARVTGSKVLAFDRPAFGLTSRVVNQIKCSSLGNRDSRPLNPYSMMFSVLATLHFIDFMAAQKAILVGHSAGALVALDAYFEAPERVAALIFVAPAIFAPRAMQNTVKDEKSDIENQTQGNSSDLNSRGNLFFRIFHILSKSSKIIAEVIANVAKGMAAMINTLYKKALSAILLSAFGVMLIRLIIGKFGIPAVRSAWYDSKKVSDHIIQGYTKPLKIKGWDKALAEYTVAMLTASTSNNTTRLSEISCPVLIVTGDTDRLVPAWNSERLSRAIPKSSFEVITNCGHLPQEEKPDEFVSIVDKFLQKVFGGAEEPCMEAVTT